MSFSGSLGELCIIEKGTSPTLKTDPGFYPLVVTAEYRRSASHYQFDQPAVCIPLVSSTGHGDAAIHRIHYEEGKFALANLLVALIPRDPSLCLTRYLYFLLQAQKDQLLVPLMKGTANVSLKERDIASVEVTLPPLHVQQKIVTWIDALTARVNEAVKLVEQTTKEIDDLSRSLLWNNERDATPTRMSELVKQRSPDVQVNPHDNYEFAGVYCFGRGVFVGQTRSGMDFKYPKLTRLKARNFTYPKLMAWEGAFGVVPEECDGLVVSTEFPVFEVNEDKILPEVLDVYFKTPSIWPKVAGASTGTNVRRRRLNPKDFLKYEFPLPKRAVQHKVVEIQSRTRGLLAERKGTIGELGGLLKSALNQVFDEGQLA